tara:strand:- start:71 stop:484 length:414 start_codon:yes stop_codon:yes gene_type:complete
MKDKNILIIGWVLLIGLGFLLFHQSSLDKPPYFNTNAARNTAAQISLGEVEYKANNGVYYYTSGGCNSKTTQELINNLPYNPQSWRESLDENFYYCVSGDSKSNTYKITVKSISNSCELYMDEKSNVKFKSGYSYCR